MSIELEPNTWYITAGGYAVFIEEYRGLFVSTIETSPGIYRKGGIAKEAYTGSHGWVYYPDGRMEFLTPEWNEKLQIVEKAPFSSLPEPPKGYRFKDSYPRLAESEEGELFLSLNGYLLQNGDQFIHHPLLGTRRFILEKEPAQYTELKAGDVLREGDQLCRKNNEWKDCVIRENEESNTIKSTDLQYFSYRRPVQNIVLSKPDTKTVEKLRDILDENAKDIVWGPELQNIASENSKNLDEMTSTTTFEHNGVTYYYLGKDEVLKEGDIISIGGPWNECHYTIGDLADLKSCKYARPVGAFRPIINTAGDTVSSALTTRKENVMTELMNKTTPLAKSALSLCWRVVKHQANYWFFEPTKDVVSRVMRSVRYITLFSAIGAGTYAYNYPQEAKDLAMKCLPKIQVSFEKPEILN